MYFDFAMNSSSGFVLVKTKFSDPHRVCGGEVWERELAAKHLKIPKKNGIVKPLKRSQEREDGPLAFSWPFT